MAYAFNQLANSDFISGKNPEVRINYGAGRFAADGMGPPAPFRTPNEALDAARTQIEAIPEHKDYEFGGGIMALPDGRGFLITELATNMSNKDIRFVVASLRGTELFAIFHDHPNSGPEPSFLRHMMCEQQIDFVSAQLFSHLIRAQGCFCLLRVKPYQLVVV